MFSGKIPTLRKIWKKSRLNQPIDVALKVIVNPINKRLPIVSVLEEFLGQLLVEWYPSESHMMSYYSYAKIAIILIKHIKE